MMHLRGLGLLFPLYLLASPLIAHAGNGLNDIGYGAESEGMGGADLAVARDPLALNTNPAGLTQINRRQLYIDLEPFYYIDVRHEDQYGNDQQVNHPVSLVVSGGYVQRIAGTGIVAGVAVLAQGGAGFTYEGLNTAFGTRDEAAANFGSYKIEPGLAWQATKRLSLGASLGINYSRAREKLFPETSYVASDGSAAFYGFRADGLSGVSFNGKLGFQYRLSPAWVIGGAYTSKTQIRLKGGSATFDYDAAGLGHVKYGRSSMSGLAIAQQAGIGVSFQPDAAWLIAVDFDWVDWSGAMKASTLHASHPDNPGVPQRLDLASPQNWRDEYVIAVGAAYQWDRRTTLRAGLNYGRNPIPKVTTSPILAVTSNRGATLGLSHRFGREWEFSSAVLYAPRVDVTYTNPNLPFGTNSFARWDAVLVQLAISRRW